MNDMKYKLAIAHPTADTSALEKAIDDLNQRLLATTQELGNRQGKLENALLQFGKFSDAMQSLLDWLADTHELIESQELPAADPKVLKAQLMEQKVLTKFVLHQQYVHYSSIWPHLYLTQMNKIGPGIPHSLNKLTNQETATLPACWSLMV